ncbi:hypothetical protein EK21DRAFT_91181 [Setomelanomma holmii]|uniref:Uncharacterized protein n=1 Tax=Setomelanomma holmii TaxID=210430 RepID=A0A9P4LKP0_9PLEO|nr:hypothetical protein EK21DRAFT_91181 [Setomelanomma holmii]
MSAPNANNSCGAGASSTNNTTTTGGSCPQVPASSSPPGAPPPPSPPPPRGSTDIPPPPPLADLWEAGADAQGDLEAEQFLAETELRRPPGPTRLEVYWERLARYQQAERCLESVFAALAQIHAPAAPQTSPLSGS